MREDWIECKLNDVSSKITKGSTPTTYGYQFQKSGINFIKIENVKQGKIQTATINKFISSEAHESQKRSQLIPGDILFSIAGTIGETCLVKPENVPANTNQAFAIISGFNHILFPKFISLQLSSFVSKVVKSKARGGAMNNISLGDLKSLNIIIPPLPEQRAIIAKIETLFSDLDKGIADLKTAQEQLKIYRQAVLKKAFEGELTKKWREKQTDLPTADELLEQIKKERDNWLSKQISNGNSEAKRIKTKLEKLNEIKPFNKLPNKWCWTSFITSCLFVIDCHNKTAPYIDKGIYLVRTTNIKKW
ncbi:restriction endonuclease subunit S [Candidatus Venteria ishoeyi]|uniref:Type-1 restriction enzyme EcoKI specificity protein n=1 Tax=Candidatus Venteria ishoeyi TaxID=1899563 RepID=A0A1H6F9G8_9GAMM|nr:restriction endonuclease subunit S [Candidatus Venteria ishoeyi]SEH06243.1 Type-1 restriction enzyme EcoKI specificity protein [Candidatus Venteria ishoeyi]